MEHLQFRITHIRQEANLSKSYFIEEISGKTVDYKAGQFLTLLINMHGKEVRRSYSICSAPGVDAQVFFMVKRIENGELSRYLFDTLQAGDIFTSLPPTGRFTIHGPESELYVFVAAGSGISPVFSLIRYLLHNSQSPKAVLIYQNRSEEESIFREDLLQLQQKFNKRFTIQEIFSQPTDHSTPHRRLNNTLLEQILKEQIHTSSVIFYLCGPEAFMRMAEFTLKVIGYRHEQIKKENFFAVAPPPPFVADTTPHKLIIHYNKKTYKLEVAYPQNILDAALKNYIRLPYSCRGGRCSTCTSRCIAGKVKMSINDVLTPQDLADGLILTCVAYPETDVELTFESL